jgi:hypothetical protein
MMKGSILILFCFIRGYKRTKLNDVFSINKCIILSIETEIVLKKCRVICQCNSICLHSIFFFIYNHKRLPNLTNRLYSTMVQNFSMHPPDGEKCIDDGYFQPMISSFRGNWMLCASLLRERKRKEYNKKRGK